MNFYLTVLVFKLQAHKWSKMCKITGFQVEEIRYVTNHEKVPKYIICERPDIIKYWFRILGLIHGIDPQKRASGLHSGDENDYEVLQGPFVLARSLWNVQENLVDGAFSVGRDENMEDLQVSDHGDHLRHTKIGKLSEGGSFVCSKSNIPSELGVSASPIIPVHVRSLISMSLRYLDGLLAAEASKNHWFDSSSRFDSHILNFRSILFRTKKGARRDRAHRSPQFAVSSPRTRMEQFSESYSRIDDMIDADAETLTVLSMEEWPEIAYDVSSQEVSFHIPVHRLLGFLLQECMKRSYGISGVRQRKHDAIGDFNDFFKKSLDGFHPSGFSCFVMEHPLRLRVFCAQVHAGMWRRNSDAGPLLSEFYHGVDL